MSGKHGPISGIGEEKSAGTLMPGKGIERGKRFIPWKIGRGKKKLHCGFLEAAHPNSNEPLRRNRTSDS